MKIERFIKDDFTRIPTNKMEYQAPTQGHYESGLTAELMYSHAEGLIKKHFTPEEIEKFRSTPYRPPEIPPDEFINLWNKPEIRDELEEFVTSYYFTDLGENFPSFKELVEEREKTGERNLNDYLDERVRYFDSRDEALQAVSELSTKLQGRFEWITNQINMIENLEGEQFIKSNTIEAFRQLLEIRYRWIATIEYIRPEDLNQS